MTQNQTQIFPCSPQEALDCAFKHLDADISLEAQVPLSNDLLRSTAIQVTAVFLTCVYPRLSRFDCTSAVVHPGCIFRLHGLCGSCGHRWHLCRKHRRLSCSSRGAEPGRFVERFASFPGPQLSKQSRGGTDQSPASTLREKHSDHR